MVKKYYFYPNQGSTYVNGQRIGGWLSRLLSGFITAGDSSELLSKHDRQNLCLPEMISVLSTYTPPPLEYYQCFCKKFPQYNRDNTPFYLYKPTQLELENNRRYCEKMDEQKKKRLAQERERKAEIRRLEREVAEEVAEEVVEEVPEEDDEIDLEGDEELAEVLGNLEEIFDGNDEVVDDVVEELSGGDPGLHDILSGLPTRSGRVPRPSTRLKDFYSS